MTRRNDEYNQVSLQPNFKPVDHLYQERLRHFTDGGQYRELNLPKFYDIDRVDSNSRHIMLKVYRVPDDSLGRTKRPLFRDIDWNNVNWRDARKGDSFGPSWKTFWFKLKFEIPTSWIIEHPENIELEWDSSSEALLYSEKGLPLQAFTGGGERTLFRIPKEYWDHRPHVFYVEMACNGMTGNGSGGEPNPNNSFRLNKCDLVLPSMTARRLFWDFWIMGDAAREMPGGSWQKYRADKLCNDIMDAFDPNDIKSVDKGRRLAEQYLGDKKDSEEVYDSDNSKVSVIAVGNCHIDTAWLWPWAETRRKIVRSWTTQMRIADAYPEYIFVASQMQQFKWLKEDHPEVLALIKEKFATNQFFPIGGSWVENDTNLPNGESLIRQFLLGQRFQFNEFGYYSTIHWLPDTFGYSSQVPQICKIVGINKFLTQKLSWNNINLFPMSTFNWVGIDRSQVLVHMPPANTYTADAHFGDVMRSLHQNKNLRDGSKSLLLFGKGDGGGGPTEEMLEKLRRCRAVADINGILPTVKLGETVEEFYEEVMEKTDKGTKLPSWTGEMYLEFHRGTYTTQALVKKLMRINESKLHDLEWLATLLSVTDSEYKYPNKELNGLWENLCLCQFHDVLPGSSIGMVYYDEAIPMLKNVLSKSTTLIKKALKVIEDKHWGHSFHFLNTMPWPRQEVLVVDKKKDKELFSILEKSPEAVKHQDKILASVVTENGVTRLVKTDELDCGATAYKEGDRFILSNNKLKVTVSLDGVLTSVYDLVNKRETIDTTSTSQTEGPATIGGNQILLFTDDPLNFPAWDTELYSLSKFKILRSHDVQVLADHPLESSLVVKTKISDKSSMETVISLQGGLSKSTAVQNSYVRFHVNVKWHETYQFLKVQFPTLIHSAQLANYETQFGLTSRPTHYNTSWDVAKFEVCQHKFMDLSEYNYGVSVLNNCKYGGSIHGNLMRLSLLRAPKAPDNKADMGDHEFEYAFYPHAGPLGSDTVKLGYNFNHRLEAGARSMELPRLLLAIKLKGEAGLVLSHLKRAEDDKEVSVHENIPLLYPGSQSIVVRVYESLGGASTGVLHFNEKVLPVFAVYKTNALEQQFEAEKLEIKDSKVSISLRAFEIATFKVVLKN